jgi:hypothetical protein
LPIDFVESEGFKNLVKHLNPHFTIPSRIEVARDCLKLYVAEKDKLKTLLLLAPLVSNNQISEDNV